MLRKEHALSYRAVQGNTLRSPVFLVGQMGGLVSKVPDERASGRRGPGGLKLKNMLPGGII